MIPALITLLFVGGLVVIFFVLGRFIPAFSRDRPQIADAFARRQIGVAQMRSNKPHAKVATGRAEQNTFATLASFA
jgi:hypothetical protein